MRQPDLVSWMAVGVGNRHAAHEVWYRKIGLVVVLRAPMPLGLEWLT